MKKINNKIKIGTKNLDCFSNTDDEDIKFVVLMIKVEFFGILLLLFFDLFTKYL